MQIFPQAAPEPASAPTWLWLIFAVVIVTVLALDLGVFHRKAHRIGTREAGTWVCVWVALALLFNAGVWHLRGPQKAVEFLTGYIVELSLSVDNIFVFVIIFTYFGVRAELQHRTLFWGIVGAVCMRFVFIFSALELLDRFQFLIYVFGLFLVYTGAKLLVKETEVHPEKNIVLRLARTLLPITKDFHGQRFFVREPPASFSETPSAESPKGRLKATPLFLVLLVLEASDVVFAVDSVPAILGVTRDSFVAYTSNIFAILGLRSLYFLLVSFLDKFHLLKYGLSLVLIFIGAKMLAQRWVHVGPLLSLSVVVCLLGGSVFLSLVVPNKKADRAPPLSAEET